MTFDFLGRWRKLVLCVLALSSAAGCTDDISTINRDMLALDTESIDRMMRIVDERTATVFLNYHSNVWVKKKEIVDKRKEKWVLNLDVKKDTPAFMEYEMSQAKLIAALNSAIASMPAKKQAKDLQDLQNDHFPKAEDFSKVYMPQLFVRATSERMAIQIAKAREFFRLKNLREELVRMDSSADCRNLDILIQYLDPTPKTP